MKIYRVRRQTSIEMFIPAPYFQGYDSVPRMIPAKQLPKFPAALREPPVKPLVKPDR